MDYKLVYTKTAEKDLAHLPEKSAIRILKKVDEFSKLSDPMSKAKKLKDFRIDTFRFRVGDYRVVFRLDKKTKKLIILVVLKIRHRKDVYK